MTSQTAKKKIHAELAQRDGFKPIKYDYYDEAAKNWKFKDCEPEEMTHMQHIESGKRYVWNQGCRQTRHAIEIRFGQ